MAAVASQPSGSGSSSNAGASTPALPASAATTRARYAKLAKVGEGTYASVFLARDLATNEKLAIKKIKIVSSADGLDMTALREVQFLRELRHPNVIRLVDVFSSGTGATPSLNLVLEFLDTNLEALIKDRSILFRPEDIKSWMAMLCRGLEYTHRNGCLHRDLKPNNLLIAPSGELKIADFGLARGAGEPGQKMSNQVVTRWYRSPELLLGARHYGAGVDMWAVGCIFAELHLRLPYLPGESDLEQLTVVFRALGTPTEKEWPKHKSLPHYMNFEQHPKQDLSQLFSAASPDTLDMLAKLLLYDPMRRLSAHGCLHHAYFRTAPPPTPFAELPRHAAAVPAGHALLSDSDAKDARRRAGAVSGGLAGEGETAEEKARPKKRALDEKERDEQRRRIARKLAFE